MDIVTMFIFASAVIFSYMTLLFILAQILKDNSIADIAWGFGFILAAVTVLVVHGDFAFRQLIVTALVAVWGTRLSLRIFLRNRGKGEDWRYKNWRREWGRWFVVRSYLQVFILQGLILIVNVSPVLIINTTGNTRLTILDVAGLFVWLLGFCFETVGDWQLDRFIKNPDSRGKILDTGLWRYTRHPNYFGEITMWWGIYLIALSVPFGWIGFVGPLLITLMIVFVSGIPMTEREMEKNPAFAPYRERTSVLVPWFPKKRT